MSKIFGNRIFKYFWPYFSKLLSERSEGGNLSNLFFFAEFVFDKGNQGINRFLCSIALCGNFYT
mgnify:CR=1 FL=1